MARIAFAVALLACFVWAGVVGYEAWTGWPHMSLDLSHADQGTQDAYRQAMIMHLVRHAALGLAPLAVVCALAGLLKRRK
jgi:hypothetical protein